MGRCVYNCDTFQSGEFTDTRELMGMLPYCWKQKYISKSEEVTGLKAATVIQFIPSNAEAAFIQSIRTHKFVKTIKTLSCWYSLDSSRRVFSDEYPFARVSGIFRFFASFCIGQISHQQHKG